MSGAAPLAKARTMHKLGKHAACARALEDYLRSSPLDVEANLLLGESLEAASHFQSARAVFEFVAEIAPDNAEGLKHAGAMMQRTGDPAKALEYYEKSLAIKLKVLGQEHKDVASTYRKIGLAHQNMGGHGHALEAFQKCLSIRLALYGDESNLVAGTYHTIARCYEEQGDHEKALENFEKCLDPQQKSRSCFDLSFKGYVSDGFPIFQKVRLRTSGEFLAG